MSKKSPERIKRRLKRIARINGDRQYFTAVRRLRASKLRAWRIEHKPAVMERQIAQQAAASARRETKQALRDAKKALKAVISDGNAV